MSCPIFSAVFVAGPTAVGKSAVALALAERLGGEIIAVDSMQVYRGLDLGTAKPSPRDRQRVTHHLLDVREVTEPFDAAQYVRLAAAAANEVLGRGRLPVFCGGTGLYFRALFDGLGQAPAGDPGLRAELEAIPLAELLAELARHDPVTYARIDQRNPRRVIRAVEVIRLTGGPFASLRAAWPTKSAGGAADAASAPPPPGVGGARPPRFYALARARDDLEARIDARVEAMFAAGLVGEVRHLLAHGLARNRTAMQAIGYRQVVEHLDGHRSLAQTIALVKRRTRQYARRQMTWFRHQTAATWIAIAPGESAEAVAARILSLAPADERPELLARVGSPKP